MKHSFLHMVRLLGKSYMLVVAESVLTTHLRTCSELELPIILHYLIEYLGHHNALVCGLAYTEVSSIA
jgi:hypothetical protein